MKNIMCVLMCVGLASMASGAMQITNGDFEADAIGGSQDFADVAGWYESDAGSFWNKPWFKEGNDSFNGSGVVAFSGQEIGPAPDGAGLLGYLYQNIGTADGASQVQIGFQTSTFAGGATKDYGITVTILQSNSFAPGEELDILGAAGVSFIDQQTRLYTGAAAAGVKDDVWTLDLSSVVPGAGDLYLRLNHYHGAVNDAPFIHIDNIAILAILVFDFDPTPADGDTVAVADPLTLSWLNLPDPNNVADPVWVDVYWDTDAAGDSGTQVLTESHDAMTVDVSALDIGTYYWKIVATDPNDGGTPYVMEEALYSLITLDGCEFAKTNADPLYTETAAREKGDTNYDCEVNLVDFAAMVENWLIDLSF